MTYNLQPNHVRFFNGDGTPAGDASLYPSSSNYAMSKLDGIGIYLSSYTIMITADPAMHSMEVRRGIREMITEFYRDPQKHDHIIEFDVTGGPDQDENLARKKANAFSRYFDLAPNKDDYEFILISIEPYYGWYYGVLIRKDNTRFHEICQGAQQLTTEHFMEN